MSTQTEAMKLALKALDRHQNIIGLTNIKQDVEAITALRKALVEQPTPDEYNRKLRQQLEREWVELAAMRKAEQPAPMSKILIDEAVNLAAEFNRYFTSMNGVDVPARVSVPRDEWRALSVALKKLTDQPAQQEPGRYQELREVLENLMSWQVKNVNKWDNGAYDQASKVLKRHDNTTPVQEPVAWRYTDARGHYRYRGFVRGFDKAYPMLKPQAMCVVAPQAQPAPNPTLTDSESRAEAAAAIEQIERKGEWITREEAIAAIKSIK